MWRRNLRAVKERINLYRTVNTAQGSAGLVPESALKVHIKKKSSAEKGKNNER